MGILEPKHGSISPTASRPLRPLGPSPPHSHSGRSVAPLRSVPRPPTTSPTRDRSPPAPSRTRTVLTDRSVARADLAFAPRRPLPPPTASEAFAPSEVATTDLAPNARPVHLSASPHLPDLGKPTGHHQLVHRVLLHNRSTVALPRDLLCDQKQSRREVHERGGPGARNIYHRNSYIRRAAPVSGFAITPDNL